MDRLARMKEDQLMNQKQNQNSEILHTQDIKLLAFF
jgi:hypothetical protein